MRTRLWLWWHRRHGQLLLRMGGRGDAGGWSSHEGTYLCECGATRDRDG